MIVKGARQVGKTESIRRFAEEHYKNVVYINFVEEPKYKLITEDGYKVDDIIRNISRMDPYKKFEAGETILIFDELQEFPDIATSLKYFKIDGSFDVICSGFLFGIQYKRIESNSVGYKTDYNMMSMDFEEFLWAKGYENADIEDMLWHMEKEKPFNETEMKVYTSLFCVEWLRDTGIANICYCLNFPELPLKGNYDESKYKLYFFDIGIFVAMLDEEAQEDLRANKNLGVYKGALYENVVAEALTKCGYGLYYYKKDDSFL